MCRPELAGLCRLQRNTLGVDANTVGATPLPWLCVTRTSFRAGLRTFANFDVEDSDDLAALLGKRYGL